MSELPLNRVTRNLPPPSDREAACALLRDLEGVEDATVAGKRVRVTYDLTRQDYPGMLAQLRGSGLLGAPGMLTRLRAAWYGYLDHNTRDSLQSKGGACCSDPREVYARRRGH